MKKKFENWRYVDSATILCLILVSALLMTLPATAAEPVGYTHLATVSSGLKYPTDAAVADSGKIYVVDGLLKKILFYNEHYALSGSISSVENPTAVAAYGETLYVADNKTKTVKLFTTAGITAGELKRDGLPASFELPRNLTVDAVGNVYVIDQFAETIEVFDAAGNYSNTISGLSMPQDAVAVAGKLYIIDQPLQNGGNKGEIRASRIRIYDPVNGFTDDVFPPNGIDTASGQYISLKGIAADPSGNLYVNDSYLNVLYKFDTDHQFVIAIDEPLATPQGMTVSEDGRLVVTSSFDGTTRVLGVDYLAGNETWNNDTPIADAGPDQTITEDTQFILDGSGSSDEDGIKNYQWTQISGINILPSNPYSTQEDRLTLIAPDVGPNGSLLFFELIVTDEKNKTSEPATTSVTVKNLISGSVVINDGALYTSTRDVALFFDAPEAVEMRLANDDEPFTGDYLAYATTFAWTLSDYDPQVTADSKTVRVEFRDAGGNMATAENTILLDMQPPAPPTLETGGTAGDFNWNPVDDAASYTLEYSFNSDFSDSMTLTGLDPNGVTIALDGLAYGTWYWHVQSIDAAGNTSEWSETGTFNHIRPNDPPVADAGADQTVEEGATFILDGSGSTDDEGIQSYTWTQTGGTLVLSENPLITQDSWIELTSPSVGPAGAVLTFDLVATDDYGLESQPAATTVTVNNLISGSVVINDGALYTNTRNVVLFLDAPEAVEMRFANDDEPFTGDYLAYATTSAWTLGDNDPQVAADIKTVRVEFRDAGGNIVTAENTILLDMQPPVAPVIESGGPAGDFNWNPVDDAVSYILEYAFNLDFNDASTITGAYPYGLSIDTADLDYGTWYWHVRSIDIAGNESEWSDVGTFVVEPDCSLRPEIPQLSKPANGAVNISRTVTLETDPMIYHPDCGAHIRTEWQMSQSVDFSTLVMDVDTSLNNLTEYPIPPLVLEPDTAYYWRIRQTADEDNQSDWSDVWTFTTLNQPDEVGIDGVLHLQSENSPDVGDEEITLMAEIGNANVKIKSIRMSSGVIVQTVKEIDPAAIEDEYNRPVDFPLGLLSFRLLVEPGSSAQMELTYSGSVPRNTDWYIYNSEQGWHVYENAVFSRNSRTVILSFEDGGLGDADGVINGIIVNP